MRSSNDLLLRFALQRRALAFDQTQLVNYATMESWHHVLLSAYLEQPPPGYRRLTLQQVKTADVEFFKELCRLTNNGVRMQADGTFPLELAIKAAINSTGV